MVSQATPHFAVFLGRNDGGSGGEVKILEPVVVGLWMETPCFPHRNAITLAG